MHVCMHARMHAFSPTVHNQVTCYDISTGFTRDSIYAIARRPMLAYTLYATAMPFVRLSVCLSVCSSARHTLCIKTTVYTHISSQVKEFWKPVSSYWQSYIVVPHVHCENKVRWKVRYYNFQLWCNRVLKLGK